MQAGCRRLLLYAGAGAGAGWATVLGLQLLLAERLERSALKRLGSETASQLRLADLALERLPREGVSQLSGLELAVTPPPPAGPVPPPLQRRGQQLRQELCRQLGACPRVEVRAENTAVVWVELPAAMEPAWLVVSLPRMRLLPPRAPVMSLALVAAALVITTLYLELEVRRPLAVLRRSLNTVDLDSRLEPLPEEGTAAVQQVTMRFNAMLRRLELGRREQATMLAGIAHDLRSPLTRLRLRLAMRGKEEERNLADLDALERITGQFMAYAASRDGETAVEVPLEQLVGEALAGVEVPLELQLMPLQRQVQPTALSRAVVNLVDNAMAYGRPPLRVSLREGTDPDGFVIRVADCGEGIPPDQWGRALEPFQRLDAARGGSGHCGLGLAIAQQVAVAHGGQLRWERLTPGPSAPQRFAVELRGRSHPVTPSPPVVMEQSHPQTRVQGC
jgi:two-component system osmolarity sensor histidine kinase EnvZ